MVHNDWALASVRDGITAMNRRDWSAFETIHATNLVYESPHSCPILGRNAVRDRYEELVALVPDLHASDVRMIQNDPACNWATFEYVQTGTMPATVSTPDGEMRGSGSRFRVHTTLFVGFDGEGRVAKLRTAHN
jgi:hypothetical protein